MAIPTARTHREPVTVPLGSGYRYLRPVELTSKRRLESRLLPNSAADHRFAIRGTDGRLTPELGRN